MSLLQPQGLWNEINALVIVQLFHTQLSCEDCLRQLRHPDLPDWNIKQRQHFFRCSHEISRRIFYVEPFALQQLFFRRVRIPPLMGFTWDDVWIHPLLYHIFEPYLKDDMANFLRRSWEVIPLIDDMDELLRGHPRHGDLKTLRHLSELVVTQREWLFGLEPKKASDRLENLLRKKLSEEDYRAPFNPDNRPKAQIKSAQALLKLLVRDRAPYRLFDQLFTLRLIPWIFPLIYRWKRKSIPKDLRDQAMGIESLFK